jgi:hypothetical protein
MATQHDDAKSKPDPLSEALDRLYGAPLERFVALRRELVASLRGSGHGAASKVVGSAVKPSRTAWALNQVACRRPELLSALFAARDRATAAQNGGDSDEVRASVRAYRERLAEVVDGARTAAAEGGMDLGAAQGRRIGETLQAACAAGSEARADLLAGRLSQDVALEDPFAGLAPGPMAKGHKEEGGERQERQARQRAMDKARDQVATLEHKGAEARAAARQASALARRAQLEAERAARAAAEAEQELERARAEWQRLKA